VAEGAYTNLGRVLIETAVMARQPKGTVLEAFHDPSGWEHLVTPLAAGRGVILVGGHLGNWELGAAYMAARGIPVAAVVRRMRNPLFEKYLTQAREYLGSRILPDRDAVRAIPRLVASAHVIPMLADQGVKGLASTFVPFFGRLARTPKGPAVLALRLDAACVLFASVREPDGKYRLHFEPVPRVSTGDRERDVDAIVAAYTSQLEQWVRRYPEQYMWQHRRWRRRPDGGLDE
jgi:KDO2-lipid IV(A) lauroyltransferase